MKLWKFISALISATLVALMFSALQAEAAVNRTCNYTVGSTTTAQGFADCTEEIGDLSKKAFAIATVTGTNTIVATSSPAVSTLSNGQMAVFTAANSITGAATFNLDGTGAISLYQLDGTTALGSGDIVAGARYILSYQASPSRWLLMGTPGTGAAPASAAYVTIGNTASLATERALTAGNCITLTDGGVNSTATLAVASCTSANLATGVTDETGSGSLVFATSPTLVTPNLGTPSAATLTNATGLPITTGVSGLGTGVATFLATPTSANLAAALTNETGSGAAVFGTSPSLTTPAIGSGGFTIAGSSSGTTTIVAAAAASGTITVPSATDTLVGKATTDTLTNKTISGASNTLTNIGNSSLTNSATTVNSQTCTLGSSCTVTVPVATGITGLGTGVATALGVNKNTTGGIPLQSGTPTSGNCVRWAVGGGLEDSGGTCSGGGAGSPGGSSGNIQYNNAGAFGGLTDTQVTARLDNFVGDSGAGGTKGAVPAPSAGDAAAYKFLMADGTWKAAGSMKRSTKTAGYTLVAADRGNTIEIQTNSVTLSLTAAATLGDGWWAIVKNGNTSPGANTMTIDPNSTETIDGLTTSVDYPGATRIIYTNGTAFFSHLVHGGFAKFTSSGTFTIPPNLNQADVICYGAGGGGGGGGAAAAGTARASGAGGGGGAKVVVNFGAVALGSAGSGVTVTVGTGGTGGASTAAGNAGGTSSFGSLVSCYGGGPGGGSGTAATAQTGGSGGGSMGAGLTGSTAAILGGSPSLTAGAIGFAGMGAGANTGADGSAAEYGGASGAGRAAQGTAACAASTTNNGGSSLFGGGGGGNGGCITSTNVAAGDGVGGSSGTTTAGGGGATGTNGATCTNGTAGTAGNETFGGFGGGGGGSDTDSTGCTGGAGGLGGGGGGGGGGGTSTGGTGGAGGDGSVYVRYSWLGLPANDNENVMLAAVA